MFFLFQIIIIKRQTVFSIKFVHAPTPYAIWSDQFGYAGIGYGMQAGFDNLGL